jgi:glutamine---fructose-6-phosphate transaminase (isomerizing)
VLLEEIREQPAALLRLAEHAADYRAVAELARNRGVSLVRMVGHGSSDNAASFGVYAFGLLPAWTALRDSISLSVYYGAELDMRNSIVLALSQSGRTPDVVDYVERARKRGALTVAVTNDPDSVLAQAAEAVLPLAAGPERAIAATKTYTAQLAALALLAGFAAGRGDEVADGIREVAGLLEALLPELERHAGETAVALAFVGRMFVIGRGPEFATAREISLKLL